MSKRYDQKTIDRAMRLYKADIPLREIMRLTGIKSTSTIQFRCNPDYRKDHMKRATEWRKKHPKRWKAINARAVAKYQRKVMR